jgi:hypothetical protein
VTGRGVETQPSTESTNPVEKAKTDLMKAIQKSNMSPQLLIQAGTYAEAALKNPSMYPIAIQMIMKEGLIDQKDVSEGGVDYKLLANLITGKRLTEQLIKEGKLQ